MYHTFTYMLAGIGWLQAACELWALDPAPTGQGWPLGGIQSPYSTQCIYIYIIYTVVSVDSYIHIHIQHIHSRTCTQALGARKLLASFKLRTLPPHVKSGHWGGDSFPGLYYDTTIHIHSQTCMLQNIYITTLQYIQYRQTIQFVDIHTVLTYCHIHV